ncbi:hypothetical protein PINS_up021657 [Pythium insidiosum]|nr:hypothetical protein PINS_up021657 [Pythium insidiosum]
MGVEEEEEEEEEVEEVRAVRQAEDQGVDKEEDEEEDEEEEACVHDEEEPQVVEQGEEEVRVEDQVEEHEDDRGEDEAEEIRVEKQEVAQEEGRVEYQEEDEEVAHVDDAVCDADQNQPTDPNAQGDPHDAKCEASIDSVSAAWAATSAEEDASVESHEGGEVTSPEQMKSSDESDESELTRDERDGEHSVNESESVDDRDGVVGRVNSTYNVLDSHETIRQTVVQLSDAEEEEAQVECYDNDSRQLVVMARKPQSEARSEEIQLLSTSSVADHTPKTEGESRAESSSSHQEPNHLNSRPEEAQEVETLRVPGISRATHPCVHEVVASHSTLDGHQ